MDSARASAPAANATEAGAPTRWEPWKIAIACGVAIIGVYFVVPGLLAKDLLYNALGVFAVLGILWGVRTHGPQRRLPWILFALGQLLYLTADAIWNVYELVWHVTSPFPSVADAFYLAGYPLMVVGLVLLVRSRNPSGDPAGLVDGTLVAVGMGLVSWVFVIGPFAHDPGLAPMERVISMSYPLMDVVLLAMAARLMLTPGARTVSYRLMASSLIVFLGSDVLYTAMADVYESGHPIDAGWLLSYVLLGAAALHPSMRQLSAGRFEYPGGLTRRRLVLLATASLLGPATIVLQAARHEATEAPIIAMGSAAVSMLVIMRMAGLVREATYLERRESARKIGLQAAALKAAPSGILITDRDGTIQYANPSFSRLTGYEPADALAQSFLELQPVLAGERSLDPLREVLAGERSWRREITTCRKDGSIYTEEQTVTPIGDAEGYVENLVVIKRDITEQKRQEAQLTYLAQHDPLTGLLNRVQLMEHLRRAVAAARRGRPGALLYLDLDHFKVVNDSLGHAAGDRLLVTLAGLLHANVRTEDVLARLGGDEFVLLLQQVSADQARQIAEQLRELVGSFRFSELDKVYDVDVSIGLAAIDGRASEGEVLAQADIACYRAKARGRNRVEGYRAGQSEQIRLSSDAQWSVRIKDALRDGRFRLVFQPIVGVSDGRHRHYEALIRLVDDDGRLIAPSAFIPVAERFGLVHEIDCWVVRTAFARVAEELRGGHRVGVSINLSGLSVLEDRVIRVIEEERDAHDIDPEQVTFEITETAAITNLNQARRFITTLRELGFKFALDDFGSGFSSFRYLRYLPVDYVKIDGAFIRQLPHDHVNQVMVRSMNEVAHSLGIGTIAEFVEDARILETLREIGVDYAQGYYLAAPSEEMHPGAPAIRVVPTGASVRAGAELRMSEEVHTA